MLILYGTDSHGATPRKSNTFTALLIIRKDNLDFDLIQIEFRVKLLSFLIVTKLPLIGEILDEEPLALLILLRCVPVPIRLLNL